MVHTVRRLAVPGSYRSRVRASGGRLDRRAQFGRNLWQSAAQCLDMDAIVQHRHVDQAGHEVIEAIESQEHPLPLIVGHGGKVGAQGPEGKREMGMGYINRDLIEGALTAASRSLAHSSDFDPDDWAHLFTAKAARCNAAFMLALGSVETATLLGEIADAVEASGTTE